MLDMKQVEAQVEEMADYIAAKANRVVSVANFSKAPLSREQHAQIADRLGVKIREIHHPANVDVLSPLRPQVAAIIASLELAAKAVHISTVDYVIPADSPAVVHMIASRIGPRVGMIWLRPSDDSANDVLVLGGVE